MELLLPARFDLDQNIFEFLEHLNERISESELILDFRSVSYVFPFSTLVMGIAIKQLIEKRQELGLQTRIKGTEATNGAVSYLKYFGFFRSLGFHVGNMPNQAPKQTHYLPLTIITRQALEASSNGNPLQVGIDRQAGRLARVIFPGSENTGPAMMLSYCFREIIRNSFEHASISKCFVMGQRWYDGEAEIVIGDRGIGIYESLSKKYSMPTAEEALHFALLPGVTSAADRATGSDWDNTGYGLYVTSELGRRYGDFAVVSSRKLLIPQHGRSIFNNIPLDGTVVKLRLNTRDGEFFPNILNNIVEEGEKIAQTIPGTIKSASKMSRRSSGKKS